MAADGPDSASVDELSGSVRTPMGHHQAVLSHHNRVNSFGEEPGGQDGTFGDSLGESGRTAVLVGMFPGDFVLGYLFLFLFF